MCDVNDDILSRLMHIKIPTDAAHVLQMWCQFSRCAPWPFFYQSTGSLVVGPKVYA